MKGIVAVRKPHQSYVFMQAVSLLESFPCDPVPPVALPSTVNNINSGRAVDRMGEKETRRWRIKDERRE